MSIETLLTENTAAVLALTEILKAQAGVVTTESVVEKAPAKKAPAVTPEKEAVSTPVEPAYTMTKKAAGASFESFTDKGWTVDMMIDHGYCTVDTVSAPVTSNEKLTPELLNDIMMKKAVEMGDQGAAVMQLLNVTYAAQSLTTLDPSKFAALAADVNALVPGA